MWKLSEDAQSEAHELYSLLHRPVLFRSPRSARSVIERLVSRGEAGAIPAIAGALFTRSLHADAVVGISQLLSQVPSKELIHLGGVLGWSYGWYISESWSNLAPAQVEDVAGKTSQRTYILGLLSFHHNGFVRYEAVKLLAQVDDGDELRYLLIRQNDWVDPISSDAKAFVRERLTLRYLEHFTREVPLVVHLLKYRRRDLSGVVTAFVELLVQPDQSSLLEKVLRSNDRESCRCVADLALEIGGSHRERVVRIGIQSSDPVLRLHCSRAVGGVLRKDEAIQVCDRLLRDSFMPVRREAYLLRTSSLPGSADATWRECLFDKSRSLRELARFHLRDTETDVAEVYRQALSIDPSSLRAISGIAETGDESDLPALRESLASPLASMRAEAIRGIGRIGSEEVVTALAGYLTDESPRVAREASRQLQPHASQLGPEFLLNLLSTDVPEHAGPCILRMVFDLGRWPGFPYLIHAAVMENASIASYAEKLIELWLTPPRSCRVFTQPTEHQRQQILAALETAKGKIRSEFLSHLTEWLRTYKLVLTD